MSGRVWRLLLLLQCCAGAVWQQVEATSLSARLARLRFATGTFEGRHPLRAAAGRSWARHVRSWVVTTAGAQADDDPTPVRLDRPPWDPSELNTWWRVPPSTGFKHRNGVALRLGNASEPDGYDWVLYGDDDTVFLVRCRGAGFSSAPAPLATHAVSECPAHGSVIQLLKPRLTMHSPCWRRWTRRFRFSSRTRPGTGAFCRRMTGRAARQLPSAACPARPRVLCAPPRAGSA